ncbi:V-type ATPase 116kDa subunit family protein [uncultured archaeon]|nr:V-type ATPase 116kDa subunit family protein [uncultured archaeon]
MFRPARMKKMTAVVYGGDIDDVLSGLGGLSAVQVYDAGESLGGEEAYGRITHVLRRVSSFVSDWSKPESVRSPALGDGVVKEAEDALSTAEEESKGVASRFENAAQRIAQLEAVQKQLRLLKEMGLNAAWLKEGRSLYVKSGLIDAADLALLTGVLDDRTKGGFIIQSSGEERLLVVAAVASSDRQHLDHAFSAVRFEPLNIPSDASDTSEAVKKTEKEIKETQKEYAEAEAALTAFRRSKAPQLFGLKSALEFEHKLAEAKSKMGSTKHLRIIKGWVPSKKAEAVEEAIKAATKKAYILRFEDPAKEELVPTSLDNPGFTKQFESITREFGLPYYGEVDPTLFIAFSFPLIFGMMYGDVGHGLIIALAGLFVRRRTGGLNMGTVILLCGASSMVFGALYGSYFGKEDFIHGLLFSPLELVKEGKTKTVVGYALAVGVIQMGLGLVLSTVNRASNLGLKNTALGSLGRALLFVGVVSLITVLFGFPIPAFTLVSAIPLPLIGLIGVVLPIGLITLEEVIHASHHHPSLMGLAGAAGNGAFEAADSMIMFLSNTISYSRIFILVLIHGLVSEVIFTIGKLVSAIPLVGAALNLAVVIGGTVALLLALEGLVVYIHTIRLHYYEWFTKFYTAGGIEFTPFTLRTLR